MKHEKEDKEEFKEGIAILADGEVSGHYHKTTKPVKYKPRDDGLAQELIIEQPTEIVHEEHNTITLPPGEVDIILQEEYDVVEGTRRVLD